MLPWQKGSCKHVLFNLHAVCTGGQAYLTKDIGLSMMIMHVCYDKYLHPVNNSGCLSNTLQHNENCRHVQQHSSVSAPTPGTEGVQQVPRYVL